MKQNPLVVFTGLAVASLAGLVAASYDRITGTSEQPASVQEQAAEPSGQPESAEQAAAPAQDQQQAAVTPEQPAAEQPAAEQPAAEQPAAEQPAAEQPEPVKPTFDTVRVEKTGEAVIAGRAEPGAEVAVKLNGETVGTAVASEDGSFVVIPDKPLPQGAGELSIESRTPGATEAAESEAKVAVAVPEQPDAGAMVAVIKPDEPTQVIQQPAAETAPAEAGGAAQEGAATEAPAKSDMPASMVSLDTVDYDDSGNLLFSGRGQPGATVRLYVDNAAVGDAVAGPDGRWTFAGTASIAPGNHTLRADELDSSGGVTSRVELPFFREEPKQVAAAAPEAGEQPAGEAPAEQPAAEQPAAEQTAAAEAEQQEEASAEPAGAAAGSSEAADEAAAQPAAGTSEAAATAPKQGRIVIQPGNNLWRISRVIYGRGVKYSVIYEANKDRIRDPDLIYPGQVFATPDVVPPETIDPKRRTPLTPEEGGTAAQP